MDVLDHLISGLGMLLVALGVALLVGHVRRGASVSLERMRATAELSYKRLRVDASAPELAFDGRTAEVMKVEEEVLYKEHVPSRLLLHFYARNPHGEYFYVIARNDDGPFVKHIAHASARAILKEKYLGNTA